MKNLTILLLFCLAALTGCATREFSPGEREALLSRHYESDNYEEAVTSSTFAQDASPSDGGDYRRFAHNTTGPGNVTTCRTIGTDTVCSDGTSYRQFTDTILSSNGRSYRQAGNSIYSSDGTVYRTSGNITTGSDGSQYRRQGDTLIIDKAPLRK